MPSFDAVTCIKYHSYLLYHLYHFLENASVIFDIPNQFKATLTITRAELTAPWRIVDLFFYNFMTTDNPTGPYQLNEMLKMAQVKLELHPNRPLLALYSFMASIYKWVHFQKLGQQVLLQFK